MRKAQIISLLYVSVFVLFTAVLGANSANATVVACPEGYTCVPINQTSVACPAGYICEPIRNSVVPPVITNLTVKKEDGSEVKWCYSFSKNLGEVGGEFGYSSTGADVVALQSRLISMGYDIPSVSSGGSAKGQFDEDTKNAVMKYQASKGITSNGYVGPLTRASLNSSCQTKNTSPAIRVLSPNGGENLIQGQKYVIKWSSYGLTANDKIFIHLFRSDGMNRGNPIVSDLPYSQTEYTWVVNTNADWGFGVENSQSTIAKILGVNKANATVNYTYKIFVGNVKGDVYDYSDNYFTVSNSATPSPTPSASNPIIYNINPSRGWADTRVIIDGSNLSDVTGLEFYGSDGKIVATLLPSSVSNQQVVFFVGRGFVGNSGSGDYKVSVVSSNCKGGCNSNRLNFTLVDPNTSPSPSPSPIQSPGQPSVSFISPRGSETWNVGDTKNVSWSYANFNTTASGDKFVELQLLPQDGRAPVVLGTYTYPYSYQPLNIYTKTSTGRDAWLPGQYKLRIACKSSNIDGFRTCAETLPGYITVPATPSPSPATGSTIMKNVDASDLNAQIWSAIQEYNRTR